MRFLNVRFLLDQQQCTKAAESHFWPGAWRDEEPELRFNRVAPIGKECWLHSVRRKWFLGAVEMRASDESQGLTLSASVIYPMDGIHAQHCHMRCFILNSWSNSLISSSASGDPRSRLVLIPRFSGICNGQGMAHHSCSWQEWWTSYMRTYAADLWYAQTLHTTARMQFFFKSDTSCPAWWSPSRCSYRLQLDQTQQFMETISTEKCTRQFWFLEQKSSLAPGDPIWT